MKKNNHTHQIMMTIERFSQLLDAYGGDAKRWPTEERATALQLLEQSNEARQLQQSALTLDNLLDSVPISSSSTMLRKRILAKIHPMTSQTQDAWQWLVQLMIGTTPREHIWRPAVTLGIPLLLGIVIGLNLAPLPENTNIWIEEEINLLALGVE